MYRFFLNKNDNVHKHSFQGGLGIAPQTLDHGQYFALILFKLNKIWQVDSQENQ